MAVSPAKAQELLDARVLCSRACVCVSVCLCLCVCLCVRVHKYILIYRVCVFVCVCVYIHYLYTGTEMVAVWQLLPGDASPAQQGDLAHGQILPALILSRSLRPAHLPVQIGGCA